MVSEPTRGDALLDVYLIRPENVLILCKLLPGISDHKGVLLEVEWIEKCRDDNAVRRVLMYHKTNVLGMQSFLQEMFKQWAGKGSCVEEIWTAYKEGIKRFVPHKILFKNPDPEYYTREVKRLKSKVRNAYNKSKSGQLNHE